MLCEAMQAVVKIHTIPTNEYLHKFRVHVEREYLLLLLLLLLFLFGNACFSNGLMVGGYAYRHC